MSQLRLVVSRSSIPNSKFSKLVSVTCKPLRANYSELPSVAKKAATLHALRPAATELLEELIDELIAEVS